jgi:hypothetical protein
MILPPQNFALICRMLTDPSFLHKMTVKFLATLGSSVWWEMKNCKERYAVLSSSVKELNLLHLHNLILCS